MKYSDKQLRRWTGAVAACAVALGLTACGDEEAGGPECGLGAVCGTTAGSDAGALTTTIGTTAGITPATGIPVGTTGSAGGPAGSTTGGGADVTTGVPSAAGGNLPCDVAAALEAKCGNCHGAEKAGGAPMSLASLADFAAPLPSDPTITAAQGVLNRIQPEDPARKMPPPGLPELTAEEMSALDGWLNSGTPGSSGVCDGGTQPSPGGTAGGTKAEHDPTLDCYEFRAHAPGSKETPFKVGTARDQYMNFTFNSPWEGTAYGREFNIILDNKEVVHHWLLFQNGGPGQDGAVSDSSGSHPDGELMYGWAPGGNSLNFAEFGDMAMELKAGISYTLELHYNSSDPNAEDMSGVEVCVTHEPTEELAGTAWLGSDAIFGDSVTGVCKPAGQQAPIRLLGVSPHMHVKGRHMTSVIHRADGTDEMLHDMPFDFNYQTYYFVDQVLMPGDSIETTCKFSEFATFGTGTTDEMCYLFTVHSPAGALTDNGPAGIIAHGDNACLGL